MRSSGGNDSYRPPARGNSDRDYRPPARDGDYRAPRGDDGGRRENGVSRGGSASAGTYRPPNGSSRGAGSHNNDRSCNWKTTLLVHLFSATNCYLRRVFFLFFFPISIEGCAAETMRTATDVQPPAQFLPMRMKLLEFAGWRSPKRLYVPTVIDLCRGH